MLRFYCYSQENPSESRDFLEPKTKIYETLIFQPSGRLEGHYDKNRCKNNHFFKYARKKTPFLIFFLPFSYLCVFLCGIRRFIQMEKSRKNLTILAIIMGIIWISLLYTQIHLTERIFYSYKQIFQNKLDIAVNESLSKLDGIAFNSFFQDRKFYDWSKQQFKQQEDPSFDVELPQSSLVHYSDNIYFQVKTLLSYMKETKSTYDYNLIDYDVIDSLISTKLHDNFIYEPFMMGIYSASKDVYYTTAEGAYKDLLFQKGFKYSLLCITDEGKIATDELFLFFPNLEYRFHWDIVVAYVVIVLLLLILLYCFIVFVVIVIRIRKVNEFRISMLNNITHELKTPVTTISLASQFLKDKSIQKDEKAYEDYLNMISEESASLQDLIDEVLTIFRSEQIPKKDMVDVEIHPLIKNLLAVYQLQLDQIDAVAHLDLQAEKDVVSGIYVHLSNAFSNLIDNAIKYRQGDLVIDISTRNVGNSIEICFKDNGIGIDKANQQLIFEPFARVNTENGHYVKGYGLGLNYVNQIMNYHKGTIKVESEVGKGAKFIVSLPLKTK